MRDALSLLDQAIAHGAGRVDEAQVREMLGTVDLDYLFNLFDALLAGDAAAMLQVADDMATRSLSFDAALQELASLFTRLQVAQLAPSAIADDLPERARLLDLAACFDAEFVQLGYQIAVHGRRELPLAPDEQAGFIMTLLRLHTFRPTTPGERAKAPRTAVPASRAAASVQRPTVPVVPVVPAAAAVSAQTPAQPVAASEKPPVSEESIAPAVAPSAATDVDAETQAPATDWHSILEALKLGGMARELAQHCQLLSVDGARIVLCLSPAHRHLQMKPAHDKLQQVLSDYFGRSLQLSIELQEVAGDTPAATAQRRKSERQQRAVEAVEQDDFVREVIEVYDATLVESSIKPVQLH